MTELDLYKFITEKNVEYHWYEDKEVFMCLYVFELENFMELLSKIYGIFDDGGIKIILNNGYVSIDMMPICEYCGIDPEKVFTDKTKCTLKQSHGKTATSSTMWLQTSKRRKRKTSIFKNRYGGIY